MRALLRLVLLLLLVVDGFVDRSLLCLHGLRGLHGLHVLHGLHGLRGLHGLHGLHGCRCFPAGVGASRKLEPNVVQASWLAG